MQILINLTCIRPCLLGFCRDTENVKVKVANRDVSKKSVCFLEQAYQKGTLYST